MADVFISYSRKDGAFVKALHGVLAGKGRDVWVDWEDIPPSVDWKEELAQGIDSAAALVFVISPDSLASEVCARELDQALARGKRVIPIVVQEPDGSTVPQALADRNWIFFRSDAEFDEGVAKLESALDTDAEWVREHTRLLVRANEWDRSEREDNSLLLRGAELSSAESALSGWSAGTEPAPTHVQHEFVAASRAAAVRRTRLLLGGVAVALVVSVVLGIFTLIERNRAIDREREAESRALAVEALLRADSDPELSVLLGIEAARLGATPEAEEALRRAVSGLQGRGALRVSRKGVIFTSVKSPSLLLAGAEDGAAKLWDIPARDVEDASGGLKSLSAATLSPSGDRMLVGSSGGANIFKLGSSSDPVTLAAEDELYGAGFSDDGKRVVGLEGDSGIAVWDAASGRRLGVFSDPSLTLLKGSTDRRGRRVAATFEGGRVSVWDTRSGQQLPSYDLPRNPFAAAELSPDGRWAVGVSAASNDAQVWDVATGRRRFVLRGHELPAIDVAVSRDGKYIVTGAHDNKARVWSAESGRALRVLRGHGDSITRVGFSRDNRRVLTVSNDETARVWSVETGETLAVTRGHQGEILSADLSFDGRYVMTGGRDGTARLFEASPGRTLAALSHRGDAVEAAAFDPSGKFVASSGSDRVQFAESGTGDVLSRVGADQLTTDPTLDMAFDPKRKWLALADGAIVAFMAIENDELPYYTFDGYANSVAWSRDGRRLVAASSDGTVVVLDPASGKPVGPVMRPGGNVIQAEFVGRGDRVVTLDAEGNVRLLDARTGREVVEPLESGADAVALAMAPDGRTFAVASSDTHARLWRPGSKARRLAHKAYVTAVRFSPDGSLLATASGDGTARVWDVASGKLIHTLRRHTDVVLDVDFTPDGRFLISAGADRQALLWNLDTTRVVSVFGGYDGQVMKARFSRDGSKILTVPDVGAAAVFACDACGPLDDVIERARRLVGRSLTAAERERFLD